MDSFKDYEDNMKRVRDQRIEQIDKMRADCESFIESHKSVVSMITYMDTVEKILKAHGGESKANFIEVNRTFLRVKTRVPTNAPIYPDMESSPVFSRGVIEYLLKCEWVSGVRWLEDPQDRGSIIIISIKDMGI